MRQSKLKMVLRLFALVATINYNFNLESIRRLIRDYLDNNLSEGSTDFYERIFDFYYQLYSAKLINKPEKVISMFAVKILRFSYELKIELVNTEKTNLILLLLKYFKEEHKNITENAKNTLSTILCSFGIEQDEMSDLTTLLIEKGDIAARKDAMLIIKDFGQGDINSTHYKYIHRSNMKGEILLYNITSLNIQIFIYNGTDDLYFNGYPLREDELFVFQTGSIIHGKGIQTINYGEVSAVLSHYTISNPVNIICKSAFFRYKHSEDGLQDINLRLSSGEFVGILGASGTGKTTLLKLLSGSLMPYSGQVLINGHDLYKEQEQIKGIIGYIPQEDYLIEDLTVFDNLYFTLKLCYGKINDENIERKIDQFLEEFDLVKIKYNRVGPEHTSNISGGQRKRLNVILELLREPNILFVDEPTSGLSYIEAYKTVSLLKEQTKNGKIIICTLHQPSSEIFNLLNKLIILDNGGVPIFFGNPSEAIVHFKTSSQYVNPLEIKCSYCGNINTSQIFDIIEENEVDEFGKTTGKRKRGSEYWNNVYKKNNISNINYQIEGITKLPEKSYDIPSGLRQFYIFFTRNVKSRLSNLQYLAIVLCEAPLLAIILSVFTKYIKGSETNPQEYLFSENVNIPAYFFMSVVVAVFIGMILSAEEIYRDKKTLIREKYIELSRNAYLLSKIAYLFTLSSIQFFMFVIIGNKILDIKGIGFYNWLILLSVACNANVIGLVISSSFKSIVTVYIAIPILIIPQILLGGAIIDYTKINTGQKSYIATPVYGDIMATRWAYEAIMVYQFSETRYGKLFFAIDKEINNYSYYNHCLIPAIIDEIYANQDSISLNEDLINNGYAKLLVALNNNHIPDKELHSEFNESSLQEKIERIKRISEVFKKEHLKLLVSRDKTVHSLTEKKVSALRQKYYNSKVADFVLDRNNLSQIIIVDNNYVRTSNPIYRTSYLRNLRAHFYASEKKWGEIKVKTVYFNILLIWSMTIVLYLILYYDIFNKISRLKILSWGRLYNK